MTKRIRLSDRQRGYGPVHRALRKRLGPIVATGTVPCARCGELIKVGELWDLGHDDLDRRRYSGPEHARRNRQTSSHRVEREKRIVSRDW
jgi:hypothetical protein